MGTLTRQAIAFVQLGKAWEEAIASFAEAFPILDPEVIQDVLDLLDERIGGAEEVYDLVLSGDRLSGLVNQRLSFLRTQLFEFDITGDRMRYKLAPGSPEFSEAESDEEWLDAVEYAAKTKKKPKCKPGNVDCGQKCQSAKLNCFHGMSPEQKKKAQAAIRKAKAAVKKTGGLSTGKLAEGHVLSRAARISQEAIDSALDAIQTTGAAERVRMFRDFVKKNKTQSVFWDEPDSRVEAIRQAAEVGKELKNISFVNAPSYRQWLRDSEGIDIPNSKKLTRSSKEFADAIVPATAHDSQVNGYTIQISDHVVVNARPNSNGGKLEVTSDSIQRASDAVLMANVRPWSVSESIGNSDPDFGTFATYLHEMGHQVFFKAGAPYPGHQNRTQPGQTQYSNENSHEWFAEHFAIWMLDAERLKAVAPIAASFIEDTFRKTLENKKK